MKKILLILTLAFIFIGANAQCTPDSQYTIAGIYPDSATGLPNAMVGQAYNEVITIISPVDTPLKSAIKCLISAVIFKSDKLLSSPSLKTSVVSCKFI